MNKETYKNIIADLTEKVKLCKQHFGKIHTTDDIMNMTIAEVNAVKEFASKAYVEQTQALMVDLYHILGMGELNAVQERSFLKLIREYSSYRSMFNAFKDRFADFKDIPVIPVRTKFKTISIARGTEFFVGDEDAVEVEDVCSIDEYNEATKKNVDEDQTQTPNYADGLDLTAFEFPKPDSIKFLFDDVDKLKSILEAFPVFRSFSYETLQKKIKSGSNYLGIKWSRAGATVVGVAQTDNAKNNFLSLYSKKLIAQTNN